MQLREPCNLENHAIESWINNKLDLSDFLFYKMGDKKSQEREQFLTPVAY